MTTTEKNIEEVYTKIKTLVWYCVLSEKKNDRMKFGKQLLEALKSCKESSYKEIKLFDDTINKLIDAAKTIQDQNEWIKCLTNAITDRDNNIMYAALTARKTLQEYKKERLKRKD